MRAKRLASYAWSNGKHKVTYAEVVGSDEAGLLLAVSRGAVVAGEEPRLEWREFVSFARHDAFGDAEARQAVAERFGNEEWPPVVVEELVKESGGVG